MSHNRSHSVSHNVTDGGHDAGRTQGVTLLQTRPDQTRVLVTALGGVSINQSQFVKAVDGRGVATLGIGATR